MRATVALSLLAAAMLVSACGGDGDGAQGAPGSLFVQTAHSGGFRGGELRLEGVSPVTTTFTERPDRDTGLVSTADFTAGFEALFGADPPNATVSSLDQGRGEYVVELSRPRYGARRGTLTYAARPLDGDADPPRSFGPASVFIDASGAAPLTAEFRGTVTDQDGGGIPGVVVELGGANLASTETDGDGNYALTQGVPAYTGYDLTAELEGLPSVSRHVTATPPTTTVDFTLQVASG